MVLSPAQFAELLGLSRGTVYFWLGRGRLRGAARKRGKHWLILREAALKAVFHGTEWDVQPRPRQ
ncbi:helix-turn-helix domain-containing protein [Limnoglobus roseus]